MRKRGENNKRGQVTIYVIIAIFIIAIILFLLLLIKQKGLDIILPKPSIQTPSEYIEKCARDSAQEAIEIMLPQGGYLNPENYRIYNKNKVAYLCYNHNFYQPCITQEPAYFQ